MFREELPMWVVSIVIKIVSFAQSEIRMCERAVRPLYYRLKHSL
jgi:hypothetical protein